MMDRLKADLKQSMNRRDRRETAVLRLLMGAIANAEARSDVTAEPSLGLGNEVERRELESDEVDEILRAEHRAFVQAAAEYDEVGRPDRADELRTRAVIVERYLT